MGTISPPTATNSETDKAKLLDALHKGGDAFLRSVTGVDVSACCVRPAGNRWSVLECAEHVAVAEEVMLSLVTDERKSGDPERPKRDERILRSGTDRSTRFEASDRSEPRDRFSTLPEAVAHFQAVRKRTLHFVEHVEEDLRATEVKHPHHAVGVISTYECLLLMGSHAQRHALQIEEIKNSPEYRAEAAS